MATTAPGEGSRHRHLEKRRPVEEKETGIGNFFSKMIDTLGDWFLKQNFTPEIEDALNPVVEKKIMAELTQQIDILSGGAPDSISTAKLRHCVEAMESILKRHLPKMMAKAENAVILREYFMKKARLHTREY